jgi:hypothetical protein
MSNATLTIYRLPTARATPIGRVRVVFDRNLQIYVGGSRLATATPSGEFLILTLANEEIYFVKAKDYQQIQPPQRSKKKR